MHTINPLFFLLSILTIAGSSGFAQGNWDFESSTWDFEANYEALIEELEEKRSKAPETKQDDWETFQGIVESVKQAIDDGDSILVQELLEQERRGLISPPESLNLTPHRILYKGMQLQLNETAQKRIDEINDYCDALPEKVFSAERSRELEPLLVEISFLSIRILPHRDFKTHLDTRYAEKLRKAGDFVRYYCTYLDAKAVGNAYVANDALDSASRCDFGVELLSLKEIDALKLDEYSFLGEIFEGVERIEDFRLASERLKKRMAETPPLDGRKVEEVEEYLTSLFKAAEFTERGQLDLALTHLNVVAPYSMRDKVPGLEEAVEKGKQSIIDLLSPDFTDLKRKNLETAAEFLYRIADADSAAGNHSSVYQALKLIPRFVHFKSVPLWVKDDTDALKNFILGKRYSDSGDYLMAMHFFTKVLRSIDGKYAPIEAVETELEEIRKKNPDKFDYWNDVLISEMEYIRSRMQENAAARTSRQSAPVSR